MRSAFDLRSHNTLESQDGMQGLKILSINVLLLQISGIWPSGLKKQTIFHKLFTAFHISVYVYGLIGCGGYLFLESKEINEVVERASIWITTVKHLLKLIVFLVNRDKIVSLIRRTEQNFFIHGSKLNKEDKTKIILEAKKIRQMSLGFTCLVILTAILYLVHPVVKYFVDGSTIDGERFLHPFKHKVFFDVKKSPFYELEWLINILGCFFASWCSAAADTLVAAICLILICQFQMLACSLRKSTRNIQLKLTGRADATKKGHYEQMVQSNSTNNKVSEQRLDLFEENDNEHTKSFHSEMNQYLIECIQHHQSLLQYVDDVNDALGYMFLSDSLITAILACILEYWLIVTEDRGLEFIKAILHLTCLLIQFLLYNYLSSELSFMSEDVSTAAYDSKWYEQKVNYQRNLCMLIMRAQKPVALNVPKCTAYSLPLFASVMQSSYSYLAVMRSFHQSMEPAQQ